MQFHLSLALSIHGHQILFSLLIEEAVLEVDESGDGADEFVASVVKRAVLHGVLRVLHVELELRLVVGPSVDFAHCE